MFEPRLGAVRPQTPLSSQGMQHQSWCSPPRPAGLSCSTPDKPVGTSERTQRTKGENNIWKGGSSWQCLGRIFADVLVPPAGDQTDPRAPGNSVWWLMHHSRGGVRALGTHRVFPEVSNCAMRCVRFLCALTDAQSCSLHSQRRDEL